MDHHQQQQPQENSTTPEVLIEDCHQQQPTTNGEYPLPRPRLLVNRSDSTTGAKTKRKTLSTRRRLNAMVSNASLHFSDTDSEGELAVARVSTPSHTGDPHLLQPTISVTLDASDDGGSSCGERRNSYLENLTDVDELYASEPEGNGIRINRGSLAVVEPAHHQGDTELEDMSNDDEEETAEPAVFVRPRSDILTDFNGETITTREGDGPFSVEIRNQMSLDEGTANKAPTPDIAVLPTTDSEEMEASDEEAEAEGACGQRDMYDDFDVSAASQIVMKNVSKMEQQLLAVREPDEMDSISDCHTDVEDVE